MRKKIGLGVAAVLGFLYWAELIFSSVPSLLGIEEIAITLGWTATWATGYFVALAALDLLGGGAAITAMLVARGDQFIDAKRILTTITVVYGVYQLVIAFRLPVELEQLYVTIGLVYLSLGGIFAWLTR